MTSQPGAAQAEGAAPAEGTAPAEGAAPKDRLDRLEQKVGQLADAVAKLVPGSHDDAQQRTEDRLDRPSSVQQQVREELQRARDEEAAAAAAEQEKTQQQQMAEQLARLQEQPPAAPVPRRTKILGWGD